MARTKSARPGGAFAPAKLLGRMACGLFDLMGGLLRRRSRARLRLAAAGVGLLAATLPASADLPPLLAALTGMLAILLALGAFKLAAGPSPAGARGAQTGPLADRSATAAHEPAAASPTRPRLLATEIIDHQHSQLLAIVGAASRARRCSETNGGAWAELMARVSHEFRTPLNAVIGFSDVMNSELLGPVGHPRYREYARHIRDSGRELLKSAEDTLAITCLLAHPAPRGPFPALDLDGLARDAWSFLAAEALARGIRLEVAAPEGLELSAERCALRQILINLFSEAIARTEDGGPVLLIAGTDGDVIRLEVAAPCPAGDQVARQRSMAVCLARALLELQGASLAEASDGTGGWRASTVLGGTMQQDFFPPPGTLATTQAYVC